MSRIIQASSLAISTMLTLAGSACTPSDSDTAAVADERVEPARSHLASGQSSCTITGWTSAGMMAVSRLSHAATLLASGDVLVTGGYADAPSGRTFTATAELYSHVSGVWTGVGAMSLPRVYHTATRLSSGKVLVTGGVNGFGTPKYPKTTEVYDPATQSFSSAGDMGGNRASHTATLLSSGKVLITGGVQNGVVTVATAELYDPATGTFTPTGSMASSRMNHTATLLASGKVLVAGGTVVTGGLTSDVIASAEIYDPVTGSWSPAGSMDKARFLHSATLLPSGKVLVAGGATYYPSTTFYSAAELYDPATGQWSPAGSGCIARRGHSAVLLNSGKVLLAGGYPAGVVAEVYDPSQETWETVPTMSITRDYSSATLLSSGQVLVAGGLAQTNVTLATSELYRAP